MLKKYIFCTGIYIACCFWDCANGQYFEDTSKTFEKFEFDMMNRGSFNISQCLKDLMNCFELVRGEVICTHKKMYDSVCGTTREVCHDAFLDYDSYSFKFETKENACNTDEEQLYS